MQTTSAVIEVAVGIILDEDAQHVLITKRRPNQSHAGYWEFPGGKCEGAENAYAALQRELHEEVGIEVMGAKKFLEIIHHYPDRSVRLHAWLVQQFLGQPAGIEGQECIWISFDELGNYQFPEGNYRILEALKEMIAVL